MADPIKKAQTERMIVLGLVVVFALTGGRAASQMGWLKAPRPVAAQPALDERVDVSRPLDETMQNHWRQMESPLLVEVPSPSPTVTAALAPPVYTADTLRDPLVSLLPKDEAPGDDGVSVGGSVTTATTNPSSPSPPPLTIQGVWWGGLAPLALVDGKVCSIGTEVEGATITAIDRRGVTVDYQGTTVLFTMSHEEAAGDRPRAAGMPRGAAASWR